MVTQHNISAINFCRNLGISQSVLSKNLERLSPRHRINHAGDNVVGLATSESMRSQINDLSQASANAKNAIGLIKATEGALPEVRSMLQRMTTLAEQAVNGIYNTVARGSIQEEYKALTKETRRIPENTDLNGTRPLTTGKEATMTSQTGPTSGEMITAGKENIYGRTATVAMSLEPSVRNDAKNVPKMTKTATDDVLAYCAKLGAAQSRLEHIVKSLDIMSENITEAKSRIHGIDMTDEITVFAKNNILPQTVQSTSAQSNVAPQGILSLLQ